MFFYIRWFSIISFVVVVCAATLFGSFFKQDSAHDLQKIIEDTNISIAQGFINTPWKANREKMLPAVDLYKKFLASGIGFSDWKKYKGYDDIWQAFQTFTNETHQYFESMPIAEVNIYSADGLQLFSVKGSDYKVPDAIKECKNNKCTEVTMQNGAFIPYDKKAIAPPISGDPIKIKDSDESFSAALKGVTTSVVREHQKISKADGEDEINGVVVKTYQPIMRTDNRVNILVDSVKEGKVIAQGYHPSENSIACKDENDQNQYCVEAVIAISYEATKPWKDIDSFKNRGVGGFIVIFMATISVLLWWSHRAESIIAKQHETNIELAAQTASAQAENRDKSQFLANVSHELRTPLNAIIGFSEFIKLERSGPIANEKYAEYIKDIHSSGVHLLSLINDILDYSKAEADKLELDISEVDVTKTIRNSMRLVSPRAETAQVGLIEQIPSDHFIIKTDAKKLKQIMLNLLSNATKFTPSGGSVTVTMWQNVVDGSISIEIKDTGIGIAAKDISRAMAPFGQVDNTLSRKYEGTGLGLPLTRKFVEIMGGTFNMASEVGKGTTITICLPKEQKGRAALPEQSA